MNHTNSIVVDSRKITLSSVYAKDTNYLNGSKKSKIRFEIYNLHAPSDQVTHATMRFRDATIPNYFYNIRNATIPFTYQSNTTSLSAFELEIPDGIYNIYSLMDTIGEVISASGIQLDGTRLDQILQFSYEERTNRVSVTGLKPAIAINPLLTIFLINDFMQQLGFRGEDNGFLLFFKNYVTGTYPPNLIAVSEILIQADEINPENYSSEFESNVMGKIPLAGSCETVYNYIFGDDGPFLVPLTKLQNQLTLNLYDQYGEYLDFDNYDWYLTLEINFHRTDIVNQQSLGNDLFGFNLSGNPNLLGGTGQPPPQEPMMGLPPLLITKELLEQFATIEINPDLLGLYTDTNYLELNDPNSVPPVLLQPPPTNSNFADPQQQPVQE